jgi:hypothetical protein
LARCDTAAPIPNAINAKKMVALAMTMYGILCVSRAAWVSKSSMMLFSPFSMATALYATAAADVDGGGGGDGSEYVPGGNGGGGSEGALGCNDDDDGGRLMEM